MEDGLIIDAGCCCCGCADAAPAPAHVEPEMVWEEPAWVEPAPLWEEPAFVEPTYVEPAPVAPAPPVYVEPAPVAPAPPVYVEPAPVAPAPPVYVEPAPVAPAPATYVEPAPLAPAPAPNAPLVGGSTFTDAISSPSFSLISGASIVGGSSISDAITIVDPSGGAATLPSTMTIGNVYSGGGGGATSGLMALTEVIADRQEAHRAALDAASWAPGMGGDDAVTRGMVTADQLRRLAISDRNLHDVMSPLWHSSDATNVYSPRYPGRA